MAVNFRLLLRYCKIHIDMLKKYYDLTKPGIIYGNSIAVLAGFLLASKGDIDLGTLFAVLIGAGLVMASGCVFNNYIDRDIDKKMERTKERAIVSGLVSTRSAIIYETVLGAAGLYLLWLTTNALTTLVGVTGLFFYVVVYAIAKRRTTLGTLVGAISGALPPVAGYSAVSGRLELGALLLFLVLVFWQMPHFYAIAIYRSREYANAKIPVLPVIKGVRRTKVEMLIYIIGFLIATLQLFVFGLTGYAYLIVMTIVGLYWLNLSISGFTTKDDDKWAHKLFHFSLMAFLMLICTIVISESGLSGFGKTYNFMFCAVQRSMAALQAAAALSHLALL